MAVLLLTAIVSVTFLVAGPSTPDGSSQAQGAVTVGFDMDPANTPTNSCPNDGTDCTLGTIETCVQVATGGGSVEFAVFLDDLPNGDSILGFVYTIGEETSTVLGPVTAYTHEDGTVNLPAQPGSSTFDFSDVAGTNVPGFDANVGDLGTAEYNPPFTQGTLGRYTLDTTGVADGVYGLTLSTVILGNKESNNLCTLYVCNILDAYDAHGLIAVGVPCPLPASVGGIARLPDVSDSAGPNYVAIAGLAAPALIILILSVSYARRRWLR